MNITTVSTRTESRAGARLAATDAVTLLEAGFAIAARATVKEFKINYLDLVAASLTLGNSQQIAKAEALLLLDLQSIDILRLLALRDAHAKANAA